MYYEAADEHRRSVSSVPAREARGANDARAARRRGGARARRGGPAARPGSGGSAADPLARPRCTPSSASEPLNLQQEKVKTNLEKLKTSFFFSKTSKAYFNKQLKLYGKISVQNNPESNPKRKFYNRIKYFFIVIIYRAPYQDIGNVWDWRRLPPHCT